MAHCSGRCSGRRKYEKLLLSDLLKRTRPGDLILFENKCNCGVCCISCFTRSNFDHCGLVYHGASLVPAKGKSGKEMMIELEAPHIVEAVSPDCMAGPLEQVVRSVITEGGSVYWRRINRPPMEGEKEVIIDGARRPKPIPRKMRRFLEKDDPGAQNSQKCFDMPQGYDWADLVGKLENLNAANRPANFPAHVIPSSSSEFAQLKAKLTDYQEVLVKVEEKDKLVSAKMNRGTQIVDGKLCQRQLRQPLNFREWNQQCVDTVRVPYDASRVMNTTCFDVCCGCMTNQQDNRTQQEKLQSDDGLFCSGLVALQMLRAGWRKGSQMSDLYLPADFAEDPDHMLKADLADGVSFGPMVKIYLTSEELERDEQQEEKSTPVDVRPLNAEELDGAADETTSLIATNPQSKHRIPTSDP